MNWFEEQLNQRQEKDAECFAFAMDSIAGAVMGRRLVDALSVDKIAGSALEEILRYYHCRIETEELPPEIKTVDEQIEYRTRPFGLMRRKVTLDRGWYKNAVGAMLGTLKEDGRAVALIPGKFSSYTWMDLKTGKRTRVTRSNQNLFDAEALCFYQPLPLRKLEIKDLLIFMGQQLSTSDILLYVGLMAVSAVLGLLSPQFTKWLFNDVLLSGSTQVLLGLGGFMICYSVSSQILSVFQSLVNARVRTKQNIAVQAAVMSRIMSLPTSFFKSYASGELTEHSSYVQSLCSQLMDTVCNLGLSSLFSLIYVGQIFAFAPALAVPALLLILAQVVILILTTLMQTQVSREGMQHSSKIGGLVYSTISGIQKIKLAGAEKRMFSRWATQYAKYLSITVNPPAFLKLSGTATLTVSLVGTLIMYYLAVASHVSIADYYAFNTAYGMVSGAFTTLASVATTIASIRPTLDMARSILEAEPEQTENRRVVTRLNGSIELSHVSFRYDENMPYVIDDLSLKIRTGEYLAVVGSTGCGKSTLMRLLLGFEKPQKGAVYYDNKKDISTVDLKSLRRMIGTVMQDGKLFSGDIFSNIVIAAPNLTLADAWEAARIASLDEDIRRMPMGMNTMISEGQGDISGGQKQRLMIARAVAPRPKILMFDEATSALDNITQKKVTEAVDKLKCTRIVIAHRLSTIRHADRIIYLENGHIAEEGTYEELIRKNGAFASLVERQRLDMDVD